MAATGWCGVRLGYLIAQFRHTFSKRHKDASFRINPAIKVLSEVGGLPYGSLVLDIGVRNRIEPDLLGRAGWRVTATDLFPMARGIRQADVCGLPFTDSSFSAVVASHVLEHAHDPDQALREVARVLKPGGLLWAAWPTGFRLTAHDRVDYGSASNFHERFPRQAEILWRQNDATESRVLMRVL